MQALQRLFKLGQEKQAIKNTNIANKKETTQHAEKEKKEIIHNNNQKAHKKSRKRERINLDCNDMNKHLAELIRRQNFRACFSNTLYVYSVNIKKEDINRAHNKSVSASSSPSTQNVRIKVLPLSHTSTKSSTKRREQDGNEENSKKPKAMSKMKELLRWSAAAKSEKGGKQTGIKVTHFRNAGMFLSGGNDFTSESPKISFSLIPESRLSTVGSDQFHRGRGIGNWITTDDEFVVLEL